MFQIVWNMLIMPWDYSEIRYLNLCKSSHTSETKNFNYFFIAGLWKIIIYTFNTQKCLLCLRLPQIIHSIDWAV